MRWLFCSVARRGLVLWKPYHDAVGKPDFDVVAIYQSLGLFNGCRVVGTLQDIRHSGNMAGIV